MKEQFSSKKSLPELEKEVLEFWDKNKIFEKSLKKRKDAVPFSFYDGPPFATGQPHYGHILATTIKDTVTRYKTMRGFLVNRRVGWDCHGLPVENLIEKELGVKSKREIEDDLGIEKFNDACRASVFSCVADFQDTLKRVGRWADYSNAYATLDTAYTESVWWVFKQLWDQNLVYKDYRVVSFCPRCGTSLSNFEVNQNYKDVYDPSVYIKFKISNLKSQISEYFLVWTTTPWTLPANVALAVGPDIRYVKAKVKANDEIFILAKDRLGVLDGEYKIIEELDGRDLAGLKYKPVFDFIKLDKKSHVVVADEFVSVQEGTGIVHIAPAFGEEDLRIGRVNKLPVVMTIDNEGKFLKIIEPWAGVFVKDADDDITKTLANRGILYKKERILHPYPFCWRCETPLIYMVQDSWYIRVTELQQQLIDNNQKIHWMPAHVKDGRFGKWLEQVRDWDFARSRYWGAPLPIWQCEECHKYSAIGSRQDILSVSPLTNSIFAVRHGEAEHNVLDICNGDIKNNTFHLTANGKSQAIKVAEKLTKEKIDIIISSDILRTKETATIIAESLGKKVMVDKRLRDIDPGVFEGEKISRAKEFRQSQSDRYNAQFEKGESLADVAKRIKSFFDFIGKKYKGKNIVIVSHEDAIKTMYRYFDMVGEKNIDDLKIEVGSSHSFCLNKNIDLSDLHRPHIDKVILKCQCGGKMYRTSEVFDCWFESGSMPYAQWHYPFENKESVEATFPADFIAEGMDQTRGWFYTLNVLSAALTKSDIGLGVDKPAFKNVIANGIILAEDGKKLSKRFKNYPAPALIFEKYGADAIRFFLLSSTAIGDDYRLSEKRLEETWRRVIMTMWNVYLFFVSYKGEEKIDFSKPPKLGQKDILDRWIISLINDVNGKAVKYLDGYDLTHASRLFIDFVDSLSNWYVRRSRRRFQKNADSTDQKKAIHVLGYVLCQLSQLMAPFVPFVSEVIYKNIITEKELDSVHLTDYPKAQMALIDEKLEEIVLYGRQAVALGLAARAKAGIKVRQPLAEMKIQTNLKMAKEILSMIAEEMNVKKVSLVEKISKEKGWVDEGDVKLTVSIDTVLSTKLKEEGLVREIIRQIQSQRKNLGLEVRDRVGIQYLSLSDSLNKILDANKLVISQEVGATKFKKVEKIDQGAMTLNADNSEIKIIIEKI